MSKVIGIDLGTTFSVAAYIDDNGLPQIIRNSKGKNITPSVVRIDGADTIVGENAKNVSKRYPNQCIAFAKRSMGNKEATFTADNRTFTPEEVSAIILKKIFIDAEKALNDTIAGAVVTVPAHFTDAQRKATEDAARLAGIPILAIINEPTAAALGYGISKDDNKTKTILVYDLGGGTFDVCIMKIGNNLINVLCQEGDQGLGGYDFDKVIVDWFSNKASDQGIDISTDPKALQELWIKAEEAKILLSESSKTDIEITFKNQELSFCITREEFENEINSLIYNTIGFMQHAMDTIGLEYDDIEKILLVGGSTRIPLVSSMIISETGITPSCEIHPDEAVAIGAAHYAVYCIRENLISQDLCDAPPVVEHEPVSLSSSSRVYSEDTPSLADEGVATPVLTLKDISIPEISNDYEFIGCTSHSIGVIMFDSENNIDVNDIVIPKNTPLPASSSKIYRTVSPFQDSILLTITEGEFTELRFTRRVGSKELKIRPREKLIDLKFVLECDKNGLIHAHLFDLDDNIYLGEINIPREANRTKEELLISSNKLGHFNIG